ncbi:MAG: hypothetical protein GF310_07480, partial [candidate division Zixibacteria bacterium]|nr:hypothetical protein [candidate division Zixibacteria bacterium]
MKSGFISIISIILFGLLCLATTIGYADHVCGDTNSDGSLNISDAVYLINYVFVEGSPPPDPGCCGTPCGEIVTDY